MIVEPSTEAAIAAYERLAAVYDRWLTGDDASERCLAFYRDALRGPTADVLELGCGTGRISVALAADGHRVVGLDGSAAMLARAERRLAARLADPGELRFVNGVFDQLPFPNGAFDAVLLPMRTIGHLTTESQRQACFCEVARVLRPEGVFLLDHYQLDRLWAEAHDGVPRLMYAGASDDTATAVAIWDRYDYDFAQRRLHCTVRVQEVAYCPQDGSGEDVVFDFCWFAAEEVKGLGEAAGLEVAACWGSFDRAPYDDRSDDMVFTFLKPAGGP